jgi:hypothetical protein
MWIWYDTYSDISLPNKLVKRWLVLTISTIRREPFPVSQMVLPIDTTRNVSINHQTNINMRSMKRPISSLEPSTGIAGIDGGNDIDDTIELV